MASMPLNDIQTLNFTMLSLVRDVARNDLAAACCTFGLNVDQLKVISELTPAAVMHIVARMGNEALFAPRDDLDSLLAAPAAVLPILASARARAPAKTRTSNAN